MTALHVETEKVWTVHHAQREEWVPDDRTPMRRYDDVQQYRKIVIPQPELVGQRTLVREVALLWRSECERYAAAWRAEGFTVGEPIAFATSVEGFPNGLPARDMTDSRSNCWLLRGEKRLPS